MSPGLGAALLAGLWITCATGGGAMLALLAKRIHPALSFRKLWVFYSALLGLAAAGLFAIAWW